MTRKRMIHSRRGAEKGFTLIELVLVLALIGITITVGVVNTDTSATNLAGSVEAIKGHLRYAQVRAMNTSESWSLNFTATSYSMFRAGDPTKKVLLPGESTLEVNLSNMGISVSTPGVVTFDSFGAPCTDNAGSVRQNGTRTLSFSLSGAGGSVSIAPETGYIP